MLNNINKHFISRLKGIKLMTELNPHPNNQFVFKTGGSGKDQKKV